MTGSFLHRTTGKLTCWRAAHHDRVLQIELAATAPSLACELTDAMTLLLDVDLRLVGLVVSGLDHDQRAVLDRVLPGDRPP